VRAPLGIGTTLLPWTFAMRANAPGEGGMMIRRGFRRRAPIDHAFARIPVFFSSSIRLRVAVKAARHSCAAISSAF
jgi:hypothetical protein